MAIIVKLNTSNTGFVVRPSFAAPSNPTTSTIIKNQVMTASGRLDGLLDVVEGNDPAVGSTLIYNKDTDKYEVHRLEFTDVDGPLDGGNF
jgi:hypothetical protein